MNHGGMRTEVEQTGIRSHAVRHAGSGEAMRGQDPALGTGNGENHRFVILQIAVVLIFRKLYGCFTREGHLSLERHYYSSE